MSSSRSHGTGLALHGTTVALTSARALTSHLRRRYHLRYHGRYRFARLVFGFDLLVTGILIGLFLLSLALFLVKPSVPSTLNLSFFAPPLRSATPLAFEARVIARDGQAHAPVQLAWNLPPGTEILSATPPLDDTGTVELQALHTGETRIARLALRLFVPPGSVRIGFRLQSASEQTAGSEIRPVVGSGLRFEPMLRPTQSVEPVIPFVLANETSLPIESVRLTAEGAMLEGSPMLAFDRLEPFTTQIILARGNFEIPMVLRAAAHGVSLTSETITLHPATTFASTTLMLGPSTIGSETVVDVTAPTATTLLVFHPDLVSSTQGLRTFDLPSGSQHLILPLDPTRAVTADRWLAIPFRREGDGIIAGPLATQIITTPFVFSTTARYYAATGGQIGVGPLPPRVGETTRFWAQWKLEPTTQDLSTFEARATLSSGAHLTGKTALPNGGTLLEERGSLVWRAPFLPATSEPMTAAFEIALTPTKEMRGKVIPLIGPTQATALENRSHILLHSIGDALVIFRE